MIEPVADPGGAAWALGWALLHFLWQGCAAAAVFAVVRAALPLRAARLRYAAACAAMLAMLAAPVATFALLRGAEVDAGPIAAEVAATEASPAPVSGPVAGPVSKIDAAPESTWLAVPRATLEAAMPWILTIWLAGVCLLSVRLARGWAAARRIRVIGCAAPPPRWMAILARLRDRLGMSRPVRLVASAVAEVPSVIGWLRPVVVLPASVLSGMTPWQVEALLVHELAHIRRHDYLVNLLQTIVETLLFYHPAVWWVSRQVREERERCCDDVAVELCGDPAGYVGALAELEAMRARPVLALAATGGSLLGRARRLLAPADTRRASTALGAAVALLLVAGAWASASAQRTAALPVIAPVVPAVSSFMSPSSPDLEPEHPILSGPPISPASPVSPVLAAQPARPAPAPRKPVAAPADEPDLIDQMAGLGYNRIPVQQLISLGVHGVTREWVRGMNSLGLGRLPVESLISMKVHGVAPAQVRSLRSAGVTVSTADEVVSMKIHGVTPEFVRKVVKQGHRRLTPARLVELRIHGIIP